MILDTKKGIQIMENKLIMDDIVAIRKARKCLFYSSLILLYCLKYCDTSDYLEHLIVRFVLFWCVAFAISGFCHVNRITFIDGCVRFRQAKYRHGGGTVTVPLKNISYIDVQPYLKKWDIINFYYISFFDLSGKEIGAWASQYWATDEYIDELKQIFCTCGVEVKS